MVLTCRTATQPCEPRLPFFFCLLPPYRHSDSTADKIRSIKTLTELQQRKHTSNTALIYDCTLICRVTMTHWDDYLIFYSFSVF